MRISRLELQDSTIVLLSFGKMVSSKFKGQSSKCKVNYGGSLAGGNDRSFIASHYASTLSNVLPTV